MNDLDAVLGALLGLPSLPGARCRGRSELFDEPAPREPARHAAERHAQARMLCAGCPALAACATWFDSLPARDRPRGVIAGRPDSRARRPAAENGQVS